MAPHPTLIWQAGRRGRPLTAARRRRPRAPVCERASHTPRTALAICAPHQASWLVHVQNDGA
eukprot:728750-Prymnesium_polylepis.1